MRRIAISTAIGVCGGLALAGAYIGAPYAGISLSPTTIMVIAAAVAFGASLAVLTITLLAKPEKKKAPSGKRVRDLGNDDYAHFPAHGLRLVVKPETVIEELDVVRNPSSYAKKDILLTIKKSPGKVVFNPILLKRLFDALKGFENFLHIVLVNEHDEYVGYMPAAYARWPLLVGDSETLIVKYIIDVLANPKLSVVLREINGFALHDRIYGHELVSTAQKKMTDDHLRGLVVFKGERNRKPSGVLYDEDVVRLIIKSAE